MAGIDLKHENGDHFSAGSEKPSGMSRRHFIRNSLAALSTLAVGSTLAGEALATESRGKGAKLVSAVSDDAGQHYVAGVDRNQQLIFKVAVDDRCHGGCARPGHQDVVSFARRPGRHFYVMDTAAGHVKHRIEADPKHHFYGHGIFSNDGRLLYLTANHYPDAQGLVQIFDAEKGYQKVGEHSVQGIGPHELRLHPDGETLIIALGGIRTHPDYGRAKLNLDDMQPALLLMNRHSGEIQQRFSPSHHQLSCRHLDVSPSGVVFAGYQFQGSEWEDHPLIVRLDTRIGQLREIALPSELQRSLRQYTASVAVHSEAGVAAVTAPRGNRLILLDTESGDFLRSIAITDVAGVIPGDNGTFIASTGPGELFRVTPGQEKAEALHHYDLHWDNHLTLA